jgi:hypothetical protein
MAPTKFPASEQPAQQPSPEVDFNDDGLDFCSSSPGSAPVTSPSTTRSNHQRFTLIPPNANAAVNALNVRLREHGLHLKRLTSTDPASGQRVKGLGEYVLEDRQDWRSKPAEVSMRLQVAVDDEHLEVRPEAKKTGIREVVERRIREMREREWSDEGVLEVQEEEDNGVGAVTGPPPARSNTEAVEVSEGPEDAPPEQGSA